MGDHLGGGRRWPRCDWRKGEKIYRLIVMKDALGPVLPICHMPRCLSRRRSLRTVYLDMP